MESGWFKHQRNWIGSFDTLDIKNDLILYIIFLHIYSKANYEPVEGVGVGQVVLSVMDIHRAIPIMSRTWLYHYLKILVQLGRIDIKKTGSKKTGGFLFTVKNFEKNDSKIPRKIASKPSVNKVSLNENEKCHEKCHENNDDNPFKLFDNVDDFKNESVIKNVSKSVIKNLKPCHYSGVLCIEEEIKEIKNTTSIANSAHVDLIEYWNLKLVNLSHINIKLLDPKGKRMKSVKTALDKVGLDDLKRSIDMISESDFLLCQNQPAPPNGKKPWKADFDWFIKLDNVAKILEGKYSNKKIEVKKSVQITTSLRDERELKKHGRILSEIERIEFKKQEEEKEKEEQEEKKRRGVKMALMIKQTLNSRNLEQ